ncbi:hypothetical protein [Corynebacterium silvaticum]|uniref:Uncharacterized protein n=1 Tax=Corynebacterium silvaticum TaxID=2320431 RepID=A0ACD4PYH9_9CORY|nr:hypothetical protein [Corynebacterium silvaticum]WCV10751.1 hypothetical protein CBE74_12340 [Corynebacterium silvaticum]
MLFNVIVVLLMIAAAAMLITVALHSDLQKHRPHTTTRHVQRMV